MTNSTATNQKPQQTWRERFDEDYICKEHPHDSTHYVDLVPEQVMAFIATERTNVLNEVKALVESDEFSERCYDMSPIFSDGYTRALDDILSALNKLKDQNE